MSELSVQWRPLFWVSEAPGNHGWVSKKWVEPIPLKRLNRQPGQLFFLGGGHGFMGVCSVGKFGSKTDSGFNLVKSKKWLQLCQILFQETKMLHFTLSKQRFVVTLDAPPWPIHKCESLFGFVRLKPPR